MIRLLAHVLLFVLLLAGCASHIHVADCASCLGAVVIHDQTSNAVQTKSIYGEVGKGFQARREARKAERAELLVRAAERGAAAGAKAAASIAPVGSS